MDQGKSETLLKEQQLKVSGFEAMEPSNGRTVSVRTVF